jgi:HKD family nuclease
MHIEAHIPASPPRSAQRATFPYIWGGSRSKVLTQLVDSLAHGDVFESEVASVQREGALYVVRLFAD